MGKLMNWNFVVLRLLSDMEILSVPCQFGDSNARVRDKHYPLPIP